MLRFRWSEDEVRELAAARGLELVRSRRTADRDDGAVVYLLRAPDGSVTGHIRGRDQAQALRLIAAVLRH